MVQTAKARYAWPVLTFVAAIPRILGAFFLPNAFGDAYVYIRDIGAWSTKLSAGTFQLTDLFGFWLPLYQFISALLNMVIRNGFYSGKIVSALFGAGACVFVYAITFRLTMNSRAALLTFLLIGFNPLHIFYSASAMTDVPHAFFVLAALYFVMSRRWVVAAVFAALAGFTRVESWMLIALVPAIQILRERRVSFPALIILATPPLFWFYISWKATGSWLACFQQRQQYHDWLLIQNPAIAQFSIGNISRDVGTLLVSADVAVLIACGVAGWLVTKGARNLLRRTGGPDHLQSVFAPIVFFFAFLGLLVVAYLTHQQPIIFPRYGLILFCLGLPVLAWTYLRIRERKPQLARRVLVTAAILLCLDAGIQLAVTIGTLKQISVQRAVADYLRDHFDRSSQTRIFCDEGTVRVMSGIPDEKFMTSPDAPADREGFKKVMRDKNVEYLVFARQPGSVTAKIFPDAESQELEGFDLVMYGHTDFLPTDIWLFRVHQPAR